MENTMDSVELLSFSRGGEHLESQSTSSEVDSESELRPSGKIKSALFEGNDTVGKNAMKKELNLFTCVAYVIGGTIGSGIFVTPRSILTLTHSFGLSMIIWVLGGVMAIFGGLCYIELSLLVRKSGGEYSFIKEAYSFKKKKSWMLEILGSLLAFMYFWTNVLVIRSSSLAIICLASSRYLVRPFYIDCEELPEKAVELLALMILGILAVVNCYGLQSAAKMMSVFTIFKLLTVVFIVVVGVSFMVHNGDFPHTFRNPFENLRGEPPTVFSVALSIYSVLFAYDGWSAMSYAVEETKNVKRNVPLALYIGVSIVMISYLLVNLSFFAVLTYEQIESAVAIALPFGEVAIGTAGLVIIPLLVSASAFGAANGTIYNSSRVLFVAAREGQAPKFLSGLHTTSKAPVPAILLQVFLGAVMVSVGSIEELIQRVMYSANIFICLSIIALFIFRVTHPREPRIFSAWFIIPIASIMVCLCLFLLIMPIVQSPLRPLISLAVMLTAVPVYILFIMEKPFKIRPKFVDRLNEYISNSVSSILNTQPAR